jgi:hypothetical protein
MRALTYQTIDVQDRSTQQKAAVIDKGEGCIFGTNY